MSSAFNRLALTAACATLLALALAGCGGPSPEIQAKERAPGIDMSAADRADKRGNIPVTGNAGK